MNLTRFRTLFVAVLLAASTYGLVRGSMPQVATGTWQPAGSLASVRARAASALLPGGAVLVTGGAGEDGILASAELFGSSGTFSPVAPMNDARADHAAVTLDDGRVLVVGGRDGVGALVSAEVYSAGTWSPVGDLTDARAGLTATLLDDGRVLITGGESGAGVVSSLEVFDPVSGTFSFAGVLSAPRKGHAAARLGDGRVLIAGGFSGETVLSSIDVFDAETGVVSPLPVSLDAARAGLSATTLLDGQVLFFGGNDGTNDHASGEMYNPATGTMTSAGPATVARRDHQAFLLPNNNAVLIVGGVNSTGVLPSAELYLPWLNQFWATGVMSGPRAAATGSQLAGESYGAVTGVDGRLLVAGGQSHASAELYGFATIKTDVDDYAPGDVVYVSGSGWQPGETVTFALREVPAEHASQFFTLDADPLTGAIARTKLFDVEEHHLDVRFYLTARGAASQAQTTFTDANGFSVTPVSQSVEAGSINTFTWTFAATNAGNQQTTTFTIPAGWTAPQMGAGPGQVTVTAGSCNASLQSISGMVITIRQSPPFPATGTCGNNTTFTLTYSNGTAPTPLSPPHTYTFTNQHGNDPAVTVTAAVAAATTVTVAPVTGTYGGMVDLSATLTKTSDSSAVSGKTVSFTLNGTPVGSATTDASGVASLTGVSLAGINAGPYPAGAGSGVAASFAGDSGFASSNGEATLTVEKAATLTTVTCGAGPFTYNGAAHEPCSAAVAGPGGLNEALTVTYADNVNAGTATASASYTDSANYQASSDSKEFTILQAPVVATAGGGSATYDGAPKTPAGCEVTGTYTGDLTCANNPATVEPDAGTYPIDPVVSGTGLGNFAITEVPGSYTIDPAASTTVVSCPASVTYHGAAQTPCTVSVTGAGGLSLAPDADYSNNVDAGTATASYTYPGGTNHLGSSDSKNFTIAPAPLTITASSPTITFNAGVPAIEPLYAGFVLGEGESDLITPPTCSTTYTVGSLIGTYPSTCTGAASGNYSITDVPGTVTVLTACSAFNGFLPPIGGSVETGGGGTFGSPVRSFKLNSTVPVKFSATCSGAPLTTGIHTLQAIKYSDLTTSDDPIDATPADAVTIGNQFRLTGSEWHFNLSTKGLGNNGQGIWLLRATLFDGSTYNVWIEIKK